MIAFLTKIFFVIFGVNLKSHIKILAYIRIKSNHFFICYPPFCLNIYSLS
nr:MAG TPA: hypothetical protein [Caudoviricetes sp.]